MKQTQHIAIVGAGLVGCLLARLLALRGHTVSIFEKRPFPSGGSLSTGRSTHLVISNRGWRALDAIGAREQVLPLTIPLKGRRIHSQHDRNQVFQPYGDDGQAIYAIHRNVLNRVLAQIAGDTPGVSIHYGQQCTQIDLETGAIVLESLESEKRSVFKANFVFAADGAFSKVRDHSLSLQGLVCTRTYETFGYKEITIAAEDAQALEGDAMHAWPRGAVSFFAFPNPDRSFTATMLAPIDGPNGFAALRTREDVSRLFQASFPDVDPARFAAELLHNPVNSLVTVRCEPWTFGNRIALVGDAAHAMVPFLGQGMNAGFEDCMTLISLLDRHGENFVATFQEYDRIRRPDCDAVTTMSSQAFIELTEHVGDPRFHLKKRLEREIHRLYPKRFLPPYDLIAFTHVPYSDVLRRIEELDVMTDTLLRNMTVGAGWDGHNIEGRIHELVNHMEGATDEAETY